MNQNNLKRIIAGEESFVLDYNGKMGISLGDNSTTIFFPAKPFECDCDGGAIFTNNNEYAAKLKMHRDDGHN